MAIRGRAACGSPCEPGTDTDHVLGRIRPDIRIPDLDAGRNPEVSQPLRNLGVVHHPAADERHLPIELRREVHEDLHPVDARRERRHDDLALRAREDLFEAIDDVQFGTADTRALDVGAVGEQHQDARGAELGEPVKIDVLAVERRLIDLEVPGVQHDAVRRLDGQRDAVGHAVRHAQELERERADRDALPRLDPDQPSRRLLAERLELALDQRERERRAVDRPLDVGQYVSDRADVVLVPVSKDQRRDRELLERPEVGDDQIDAEQLRLGKRDAGIDKNGRLAARDDHHVHAELADAAEWNDLQRRRVGTHRISGAHASAASAHHNTALDVPASR